MKKRFAICSTIVLLLLLSACGAPQTLDFSYVPEGEELSSLMVETSQTHRAELEHIPSAADFADAISDDPASAGLLSESEVESLLRGHAAMETVSKEQAQSDVSLLFRTLQSAYGAYEYFGQEKFDAAEDAVTQWLSSQDDEIKVSALGEKLQESLAFMLAHDAHAVIYEPAAEEIEAQVRYEYFFADGFYFSKDVNGSYYMVNDGERWTLSSFSDEHVSVQPTLLQDGRIVYQPTLFALRKDAVQSSVTLKNSSGKAKIYRLDWTESQPLDVDLGTLDYRLIQEDGLTYVSLRSFVSGTYDIPAAPDMPCVCDVLDGVIVNTKFCLMAQKGTNPAILQKINDALQHIYETNEEYVKNVEDYSYQSAKPMTIEETLAELETQYQTFQGYKQYLG